MELPDSPLTRVEQYLAKAAGQDTALPEVPLTRIEQYLDYIAQNGGGGGSSGAVDANGKTTFSNAATLTVTEQSS